MQRVARARVDGDGVAGRLDLLGDPARSPSAMCEALTTSRKCCGGRGGRRAGRRRTCPAASAGRNTAPGRPAASTASLHEIRWTAASASLPAISISPMWLTSNRPARSRTAMCSAVMPEYSTGMSQPPNGDHPGAGGAMAGVERRLLERSVGSLFHAGAHVRARARRATGNGTMRVSARSRKPRPLTICVGRRQNGRRLDAGACSSVRSLPAAPRLRALRPPDATRSAHSHHPRQREPGEGIRPGAAVGGSSCHGGLEHAR